MRQGAGRAHRTASPWWLYPAVAASALVLAVLVSAELSVADRMRPPERALVDRPLLERDRSPRAHSSSALDAGSNGLSATPAPTSSTGEVGVASEPAPNSGPTVEVITPGALTASHGVEVITLTPPSSPTPLASSPTPSSPSPAAMRTPTTTTSTPEPIDVDRDTSSPSPGSGD